LKSAGTAPLSFGVRPMGLTPRDALSEERHLNLTPVFNDFEVALAGPSKSRLYPPPHHRHPGEGGDPRKSQGVLCHRRTIIGSASSSNRSLLDAGVDPGLRRDDVASWVYWTGFAAAQKIQVAAISVQHGPLK
jgi:hypothetical protein